MTHVEGGGVPAGTTLNGMYELGQRIAMGGMGEVYKGTQIATGQQVAIKMILPEHANNELILELFRKEANTLFDIQHEAIVRYFTFSIDPDLGRPYMAMEFAGGPALADRLADKGALDEDELTTLRKRIAGGLGAAHRKGVIHRDISSDNIILVHENVSEAKIIDFGIAKSSSSEGTLIGSGFAGKLNYVSPEQLGLAGGEITAMSDIYSLGLVFAEAAIGKPLPMGGSHVDVTEKRKVVPDLSEVPIHIRPLIEWMLQPDPADRPGDLSEVANWDPSSPIAGAAGGATIVAGAQPSGSGVHPRDRLKEAQKKEDKKRGTPWGLILLGGGGLAAAAVAGVMFLGPQQDTDTGAGGASGSGGLIQDNSQTGGVAGATLEAPVQMAQTPNAVIGEAFDWTSPAFNYSGDVSALSMSSSGSVPPGLSIQTKNDGSAQISGVPASVGTFNFEVVAIGPDAERASMPVELVVEPAPAISIAPKTPETPAASLQAPQADASDSSGVSTGTSGDSTDTPQVGQLAAVDSSARQPSTPTVTLPSVSQPSVSQPDDSQPTASQTGDAPSSSGQDSVEPTVPTSGGSALLSMPSTDSGSSQLSVSGSSSVSAPSGSGPAPTLQPGGALEGTTSLTTQPRQNEGEVKDSADASVEPTVNTGTAATLQPTQPLAGDGSGLSTGGDSDGGFSIPSTGAAKLASPGPSDGGSSGLTLLQPATPTPSQPGARLSSGLLAPASDDTDTASVSASTGSGGVVTLPGAGSGGALLGPTPSSTDSSPQVAALPQNSPPTIVSNLTEPLGAARNVPLDSIIGTFFDNEGPENLRLQVDGELPNGVSARLTSAGNVQLTGTPMEYGSFPLKIAAIDPEGAVSDAFVFTLNILSTKDNIRAWNYISNYPGGECTLSRPDVLTDTSAIVEVFAAESAIDRIYKLNDDFIRDMGFEADFNVRMITDDQCPLIFALDQVGPEALDNALVISLNRDELTGNDRLVGKLQGGSGAKLYLYDSQGGLHDLSGDLKTVSGETGFDVQMAGTGSQILIAAKPRPGSGIDANSGLEALLGAAQRGAASLALGYFTMQ